MSNTYKQILDYLYEQLPMFHRVGAAAYKANLDNTHQLMDVLKHPYQQFKSIHIAGTNGKGSTSHMLAAVLQQSGYKVGLYTSPHLKDFRERIRMNGKMVPKKYITDFVEEYKPVFEKIQPSFFEWTVALAFTYFAEEGVDFAIIETGLGGRLDSTNVIAPELAIITNISMDHANLLGDTLEKIAAEKAGIIKPQTPVIIGERGACSDDVFIKTAKRNDAPLFFAEDSFKIKTGGQKLRNKGLVLEYSVNSSKQIFTCDLPGLYQAKNIATVCAASSLLNTNGIANISSKNFHKALEKVTALTGLQGRWQVLEQKPLVIADTGHNEAGILEVLKNIKKTPHKKLHFVIGMVNDKDITKVLSMLPKNAVYYFTKASIPRALNEKELQKTGSQFKLKGESYPTVKKALKAAKENAAKSDLIFIGGSTFTVADAL